MAERMDLTRALRRLPRRQRQVVVLRYLADWSEIDVAGELGCSTGAVKSHASRGLAALRRHLAVHGVEGGDDVPASR
jgi:RNA polymerase sigma factor (sigma-70 family)